MRELIPAGESQSWAHFPKWKVAALTHTEKKDKAGNERAEKKGLEREEDFHSLSFPEKSGERDSHENSICRAKLMKS